MQLDTREHTSPENKFFIKAMSFKEEICFVTVF